MQNTRQKPMGVELTYNFFLNCENGGRMSNALLPVRVLYLNFGLFIRLI